MGQLYGMLEGRFRFAGKSDHQVGAQTKAGNRCDRAIDERDELSCLIRTVHGRQDSVVSALERDMEIGTELRGGRHAVQEGVGDRRRLDRGNPDPPEAVDGFQAIDQSEKIRAALMILSDVHAGQHHLLIASRRQYFSFTENVVQHAAAFMASRKRDQAKAAHDVAAVLDFEQRPG